MKILQITLLGLLATIVSADTNSSDSCEKMVADIVFVLDDSGSVGKENFEKVKNFTISLVKSLNIGKNKVRVAAISYSTSAVINFSLLSYYRKTNLIQAIRRIGYRRGGTNTHFALQHVRRVFTKAYGDRPDALNIAILLTDGISNIPSRTMKEAKKLLAAGVRMFSIGVGKNLRQNELIAMASKPTAEYKFIVNDFNALDSITKKITKKTCDDGKACPPGSCRNGGTCIPQGRKFHCCCAKGYTGKRCTKVNPCGTIRCKNGGKCKPSGTDFKCICKRGWAGRYCQTVIGVQCSPGRCQNGGTCKVIRGKFQCYCTPAWAGRRCQKVNPCRGVKCQNGGHCAPYGNSFKCFCKPGWAGRYCQKVIGIQCNPGRCQNGGTCKVLGGRFQCYCTPAWTGRRCEKVNPCRGVKCQNGGQCAPYGNSFKCFCKRGWAGRYCQKVIGVQCFPGRCRNGGTCKVLGGRFVCYCTPKWTGRCCGKVNPCRGVKCQNGGQCAPYGNSFKCFCKPGFAGKYCQKVSAQ